MKCIVCGCEREIMIHGHYQCEQCGKTMDGDCCQGEQEQKSSKERIDENFEASEY
mgnify:FL=1